MESELVLVLLVRLVLLPSVAAWIVVVGDTVSTTHVNDAGEGLIFPTMSWARTLNVCVPSFITLENMKGLVQATYLELSILH
jgi:hypothetical protein